MAISSNKWRWWFILLQLIQLTAFTRLAVHSSNYNNSASVTVLPLCGVFRDNIGSWVPNPLRHGKSTVPPVIRQSCYKCSDTSQALDFDYIWLPERCSYHRFTNHTIIRASTLLKSHLCSDVGKANHNHDEPLSTTLNNTDQNQGEELQLCHTKPVHVVFLGDSALRGIFCAISRIYVGNETHGPCQNTVCGISKTHREISIPFIHRPLSIPFSPDLTLTFYYVKSLKWKKLEDLLEYVISITKPQVVVLSTGAWDFYDLSKKHRNDPSFIPPLNGTCHNDDMTQISLSRSDEWTNRTMSFLSDLGKQHRVRLIYRNNQFNRRFGALCADERFEAILHGTQWQIWDNRNLSRDVWQNQSYDGFHFDWPVMTYTVEDHAKYNAIHYAKFSQHPGMLVMQIAHSLLHNLFYEVLEWL